MVDSVSQMRTLYVVAMNTEVEFASRIRRYSHGLLRPPLIFHSSNTIFSIIMMASTVAEHEN